MPKRASAIWLLICNPENRRKGLFEQALFREYNLTALVVSYEELLLSDSLAQLLIQKLTDVGLDSDVDGARLNVKIESPGENFEVTKRLIALGTEQCSERLSYDLATSLVFELGRFQYLKEWSLGFSHFLLEINRILANLTTERGIQLEYLNTPKAILAMLDKYGCQQLLLAHGVAGPPLVASVHANLDGIHAELDFSLFIQSLISNQCYSVFVKPIYGSSAAGVMALRISPDGRRCVLRSSLELVRKNGIVRCYNSLKVRTYTDSSDIAALYQLVIREGAYAERWLSKAQIKGLNFDLRVVVINGKASHYVTRCSKSPMTNLHLGNQRGDVLNHKQGDEILCKAFTAAESAARVISGAGCIGVDVLISSTRLSPYIIELNAFGDLLPGIVNSSSGRKLDTYQSQVQAMAC
jgi:hypothetical protein